MDELSDDALDELVMTCLERVEEQGASAIEAVCAEHPEHAEALRARMRSLADAGLLGEPDAPPERLGDFRLGRKLGGGGMGVVYAAVQEPLEREVALKIVRADQLYFPGARERFRRELTIIARLAHAAIVPVYSAGEHDGVPYFAMERLQGATLAEVLDQLDAPARQGAELAEAVARVVELRDGERVKVRGELYDGDGVSTCLRIVRRVALALDHAHGRGVLHRDIKPSNVMLTTDGRALVFDFGLASSADAARLTQSGSRVGSMAYMAPEQLRGEIVDERSDVYGLGALLFEALTLRPPYSGGMEVVSAAILRGDPVPLDAKRVLPRDVETILRTALAHRPEHRYAQAEDLARDLEHVLERRPIEARRASALVAALRWAQRQPARAALLVLLVLGPIGFAVQQQLAARRIADQSRRADDNLDARVASLDRLVFHLGRDLLAHLPHGQDARLELLESALHDVDEVLRQRPDDTAMQLKRAKVLAELGAMALDRGELAAAQAHLEAALAAAPASAVLERLPLLNGYGNLLMTQGRFGEAAAAYGEVAELADEDAGETLTPHIATLGWRNVSRALSRLPGRGDEALRCADRSVERAEQGVREAHDQERHLGAQRDLGAALAWRASLGARGRGVVLSATPGDETSKGAFDRGLAVLMELAEENPQRSDVIHELAGACLNAETYLPVAEAELIVRHGLAVCDDLVRDYPERAVYSLSRMALLDKLGTLLAHAGRQDEAQGAFERAAELVDTWLGRRPDHMDLRIRAMLIYGNLAVSLVQLERRGEACEPALRSQQHAERVAAALPEWSLVESTVNWARVQEGHGRVALGELSRALELARSLPADADGDFILAVSAGEILAGCAGLASDRAQREALEQEALERLAQGIELGFTGVEYLRQASEWAALRNDPRFVRLLDDAESRRL